MSIEVMRRALEALEWNYNTDLDNIPACEQWAKLLKKNIPALRQAIEQAETQSTHSDGCWKWHHKCAIAKIERAEAQRQWVKLTYEEVKDAILEGGLIDDYPHNFVAIIEAKLKEKNT